MSRRKRLDDHMMLVPGESVSGHHRYEVRRMVGAGAYAVVYAAQDELGRNVALKEFFPPSHPREAATLKTLFERERYVLTQVSPHPLMPTFYEGFACDGLYYLAQEYIDGQTLEEIITRSRSLSRHWRLKWAVSLCEALAFLHGQQIVHHDLKPANIRIRPHGQLVLLDYGAAQYLGPPDDTVPKSMLRDDELYGTEGYLPPELDQEEHFVADVRTDIFALGAILYEMVMGEPPPQERINERNLYVTTPLLQRKDIDYEYVRLVTTALSYNTEYRYASARRFLEDLKKIAPPLALVTHKNLYFGQVESSRTARKTFGVYNAGGGTEINGRVQALSPWIQVEMPKFRGQKRTVVLTADPSKISERGQIVWGQVEVTTKDQLDEDGNLIGKGDRWLINCAVTVLSRPAALVVPELQGAGDKLSLLVRKGVEAKLSFTIANKGEQPGQAELAGPESPALQIEPKAVCLAGGESATITVTVPPAESAAMNSDTEVTITVELNGKPRHAIPLVIRPQSSLDFLKSRLLGR